MAERMIDSDQSVREWRTSSSSFSAIWIRLPRGRSWSSVLPVSQSRQPWQREMSWPVELFINLRREALELVNFWSQGHRHQDDIAHVTIGKHEEIIQAGL